MGRRRASFYLIHIGSWITVVSLKTSEVWRAAFFNAFRGENVAERSAKALIGLYTALESLCTATISLAHRALGQDFTILYNQAESRLSHAPLHRR